MFSDSLCSFFSILEKNYIFRFVKGKIGVVVMPPGPIYSVTLDLHILVEVTQCGKKMIE